MIAYLGGFIKKEILSFQKDLEEQANVIADVKYSFEITDNNKIKDKYTITCWHIDDNDDSEKEYMIVFTTHSLNLVTDSAILGVIETIRETMAQSDRERALKKFSSLGISRYRDIDLADEKDFRKRPMDEFLDNMF
jgi:hypothetical protein